MKLSARHLDLRQGAGLGTAVCFGFANPYLGFEGREIWRFGGCVGVVEKGLQLSSSPIGRFSVFSAFGIQT
jgi:hypothetical protein